MNEIKISVVIPCLNEERSVGNCISKALNSFKKMGENGEVIVVDNGSTDNSADVAIRAGAIVVQENRRGYGFALMAGFRKANGKYIIMGDADESYDFSDIPRFIDELEKGYEFVIGNRLKGKILTGAMPWLHRFVGTPLLSLLLRFLYKVNISDCNCGMRGIYRNSLSKMKLTSGGMEFASEMILKASQHQLKIKEIPLTLFPSKFIRKPHLRPIRDGLRHLKIIFLFSPTYLFIIPAFIVMIAGILSLLSIFRIWTVFGHQLQSHFVILGCLMLILGFQLLYLGVCVKAYVYRTGFGSIGRIMKSVFLNFKLERYVLGGISLFCLGLFTNLYVLSEWLKTLGAPFVMQDLAIVASTVIILGIQIVFSAFYLTFILEQNNYD